MRALILCVVIEIVIVASNNVSYQGAIKSSPSLSFNDKLNMLENENRNKEIQNIPRPENVNGVSGKNNQDNSKIVIKYIPMYISGNVSNVSNTSIRENNEDKAIKKVIILETPRKLNNSREYSQEVKNKKSTKTENVNENNFHKPANLLSTDGNFIINSMKPIEIIKTYRVKAIKTITFRNQFQIAKKKHFRYNYKKPNVSPENEYELFLLKDYDSPPLVKKVVETNYETSNQIKINNNDKNNELYVILNNIYSSNNKNCKNNKSNDKRCNKHITFLKSGKDHLELAHEKERNLLFKKDYSQYKGAHTYKAKNIACINCKQSVSTQKIININDLPNKVLNVKIEAKNVQNKIPELNQTGNETSYIHKNYSRDNDLTGYSDIKKESIHVINRRSNIEEQDGIEETSRAMTNKDKVIANILAPEDVKNDKKPLPYWLPSDAQEVYEMLQQPPKEGALNDSLDVEVPLKEEINQIVQLKKELGNENLEEIVNLKNNTVGIGKATNINNKLVPSLYDVYLKNLITKILNKLRQTLLYYESNLKINEIKNLDIHDIKKINLVLGIFESVRQVFDKQNDELLYELIVSLLRFNKQSEEDFDEEVEVILDSVSRKSIYGVLRYYLVSEPTLDTVRNYLKEQELYPRFVYFKTLENILPNVKIIIINALARDSDKWDGISNNKEKIDNLVKMLIILNNLMKDLGIPETTQRFIIEESILDIVRNLANAYIIKYEETVYVQLKKQLRDAISNNIDV